MYEVKIPIKFIRFIFISSVGKPQHIPFKFNNWIITLVISNLIFGGNGRRMIAPIVVGSTYPNSYFVLLYGDNYL